MNDAIQSRTKKRQIEKMKTNIRKYENKLERVFSVPKSNEIYNRKGKDEEKEEKPNGLLRGTH